MTDSPIAVKVYNIVSVVEDIKRAPQTYETILMSEFRNETLVTILRRKLNKLVKDGIICKASIPATRYSRVIFYALPKNYFILFESSRLGCKVFYCYEYVKKQKFYIHVDVYYELERGLWVEKYDKTFFEGKILMMI